nr:hypothetical protein [uncultured Rhodoferax sp.]
MSEGTTQMPAGSTRWTVWFRHFVFAPILCGMLALTLELFWHELTRDPQGLDIRAGINGVATAVILGALGGWLGGYIFFGIPTTLSAFVDAALFRASIHWRYKVFLVGVTAALAAIAQFWFLPIPANFQQPGIWLYLSCSFAGATSVCRFSQISRTA